MTSSTYPISVTPANGGLNVSAGNDLLDSDIVITSAMVSPGGGGILRLYFTYNLSTTPATITVFNNGIAKGALNADNDSQIITNGYYRFDIDVEKEDSINLQSSEDIDDTRFIRAHLVQFGA